MEGSMTKRIIIAPYDTYDLATFVIHQGTVHSGHFAGMYDDEGTHLDTIENQTYQTFMNLEAALAKINLDLRDLIKVTVILKDIADFHGMHRAWKRVFPSGYPARTTITSQFIDENCLIQIEAVAGIKAD
jgi:2-iminobutanoate/2-iminopropanoate deaminase